MIRFVFILLFVVNVSYGQVATSAGDLEQLQKFRTGYCQSLINKNIKDLNQFLSEDTRLMPEFQKTIIGRDHVIKYWTAFITRFDIQECTRKETEVLDLGGRIFETGTSSLKMKHKSTGKVYELKGKYVDLWVKETNRLLLVTSGWNYDHPVDFQDELRFSDVPVVNVAFESHVAVKDPISFELAALNRLMETTITQHDVVIWEQFYSDDGSFLYSSHKPVQGRKEIDAFFVEHAKGLPIFEKLDVRNDRIDDLGKYVIEYASHVAIVRSGEWSGVATGKDLAIWRREPKGSLKIFRHIAMYD